MLVMLASCATMYDEPMAAMVTQGAVNNDLHTVIRNVTPNNVWMRDRRQGEEPIYFAVRHGNREMINVLSNNGASLRYLSRQGHSLAYVAAANGHADIARQLTRYGGGSVADINSATRHRNLQFNQSASHKKAAINSTNKSKITSNNTPKKEGGYNTSNEAMKKFFEDEPISN